MYALFHPRPSPRLRFRPTPNKLGMDRLTAQRVVKFIRVQGGRRNELVRFCNFNRWRKYRHLRHLERQVGGRSLVMAGDKNGCHRDRADQRESQRKCRQPHRRLRRPVQHMRILHPKFSWPLASFLSGTASCIRAWLQPCRSRLHFVRLKPLVKGQNLLEMISDYFLRVPRVRCVDSPGVFLASLAMSASLSGRKYPTTIAMPCASLMRGLPYVPST